MNDETTRTREIRLRNAAKRQGLSLHKSRVRDPLAVGHGLFHIADENNVANAGYGLMGFEMDLDDVEIYLADAQAFDVHFANPAGDYSDDDRAILEWTSGYRVGGGVLDGWMLIERSDSPRDYLIARGRNELAAAVIEARKILWAWANDDAADAA